MNARLRRLYADYQKIRDEFTGHPHIDVVPLEGNPPETYRVTYRVPGLRLDRTTNRPVRINRHRMVIYLHQNYPREKPKCVMETPVFHPNIDPTWVCIGDHWAAGETIVDIIIQVGQMLQYQNYNPDSPLDAVAARWAKQNGRLFPIGNVNLFQPDVEIDLLESDAGPRSVGQRSPQPRQAPNETDVEIELN